MSEKGPVEILSSDDEIEHAKESSHTNPDTVMGDVNPDVAARKDLVRITGLEDIMTFDKFPRGVPGYSAILAVVNDVYNEIRKKRIEDQIRHDQGVDGQKRITVTFPPDDESETESIYNGSFKRADLEELQRCLIRQIDRLAVAEEEEKNRLQEENNLLQEQLKSRRYMTECYYNKIQKLEKALAQYQSSTETSEVVARSSLGSGVKVDNDLKKSGPPGVRMVVSASAARKGGLEPLNGGKKVLFSGPAGGSANAGIPNAGAAAEARREKFWYHRQNSLNLAEAAAKIAQISKDAEASCNAGKGIPDPLVKLEGGSASTVVKSEPGVGGSANTVVKSEPGAGGSAVDRGETTEESSDGDERPRKRAREGERHSHRTYNGLWKRPGVR